VLWRPALPQDRARFVSIFCLDSGEMVRFASCDD
jgi:hypothetical protein